MNGPGSLAEDSLTLRIGDITFRLTTDDPSVKLGADGPARLFLAESGEPDVLLRVVREKSCPEPTGRRLFDSGSVWQLYAHDGGYQFRLTSTKLFGQEPYTTASFDSSFRQGKICLRAPCIQSKSPLYPLEYPLDEVLMTNLLADGRGVEVHACGIADTDGRGYLFLGQSGAGKTTTARLWTGGESGPQILSDDRIILRFLEGQLWMYGTPWHGEACLASARRTPVDRIFFLARGEQNELAPVDRPMAVARLVGCSFLPFHSPAGVDFTLTFLEQVTKAVPCAELRFVPDRRAMDFVRRIGSGND